MRCSLGQQMGGGGCGDGSVDKASIRSRVQIVGIRVKSRQL